MREFSTPLTLSLPTGNLTDAVVRNATEAPDAPVLARRDSDGLWHDVDAVTFLGLVEQCARGLVAAGVEPGDRVALFSRTRWEWTVLDYAVWFAGGVGVPLYDSTRADDVRELLEDSGAVLVLAETDALAERVPVTQLSALREVLVIDPADGSQGALAVLAERGDGVPDDVLEARRQAAGPDDLATLVYSSGTTARPAGCMLTHGNLSAEIAVTRHELGEVFADGGSTLLLLPLAHVFARVVQIGCVEARVRLGHCGDAGRLVERLGEFRPSFVLAVPRLFEKLVTAASQRATADGRGPRFDRAVEAAIAYSRGLDQGRPGLGVRLRHRLADRTVLDELRGLLGGECRFGISGGAPLGERLGHFYRGIGVPVLEGYGLTETCAAVTVNVPEAHRIGTVGRPLPGVTVRLADDGELLVRGPQVFAGYWRDPEATARTLDADGWLHTGDVGEVDDEGFVRVTGRKQELLVTAGGKAVAPAVLEERLRAHPLVSQALVVGDRQPYVAALVTLDAEAVGLWDDARRAGRSGRRRRPLPVRSRPARVRDLVDDDELRDEIARAVDDANAGVSRAEAIRRFHLLPTEWTEEGGELTPSLKLRRAVVTRAYKDEIAALYL